MELRKVAQSPLEPPLHRSAVQVSPHSGDTHRGEETLSDAFTQVDDGAEVSSPANYTTSLTTLDGGPMLRSPLLSNVKASVTGLPSQHGSAQFGDQHQVLIYGELINPDSLAPLTITLFPYGKNSGLNRQELVIPTTHGRFFDGVLDPRVKKFEAKVPLPMEYAYLDMKLGGRSLLEDFIVLPSDSVKIFIDLSKFQLVFGGPSRIWYETQYELARRLKSYQFDSPRTLIELDREALLDQGDNRSVVENQEVVFGARIQILEHGKDATDRNFKLLNTKLGPGIPGFEFLEKSKSTLSKRQYQLLVSQLVGKFYGSVLSQFRRYDLIVSRLRKDEVALAKIDEVLAKTLVHLKSVFNTLDPDFATEGYLFFLSEWVQTKAIFTGEDFISVVLEDVPLQFQQQVLGEYALAQVSKQNDHQAFLDRYLEPIHENPWANELQEIRDRVELGIPLEPVKLTDLQDRTWTWDMLLGTPTLIYFYFSTCTHSARYFRELLWPLYQEMAETKGLKLIAVSVDDNPQLWKSAITEYSSTSLPNFNLPATENRKWLNHYLIDSYPRAFLLDEKGEILSLRVRENSLEKLRDRISTLLTQANNSSENP